LLSLLLGPRCVHAQREKVVPICNQAAFTTFKLWPKLEYECPEGLNDYDDKILKLSARLVAVRNLRRQLGIYPDRLRCAVIPLATARGSVTLSLFGNASRRTFYAAQRQAQLLTGVLAGDSIRRIT